MSGVLLAPVPILRGQRAGAGGHAPLLLLDDGRQYFFARTGEASGALLEDLADMGYEAKTQPGTPGFPVRSGMRRLFVIFPGESPSRRTSLSLKQSMWRAK